MNPHITINEFGNSSPKVPLSFAHRQQAENDYPDPQVESLFRWFDKSLT